ncbi:HipA domain-containing protein [Pectobacterium versatile]|uniref:HipA domain-containing protein n=1 Tax=Pectobacterium versatile TaxID=2488639 RepID=UPI0015DDDBFB|nr:HipA domain-containing protein [Pectobacterium versatile]MBA0184876.1 HipA domain-containing protein [Pectobacterium versatile]
MAALDVYMNGYRVGILTKTGSGAHHFSYDANWLGLPGSRPISLSMPLRHQPYQGDEVYNFFDNLLPDNPDISWIMRLPQEDFCQVLNVPSALKYENHGGPGISAIMSFLLGSVDPERDRYRFMQAQVLFWLLAATDGHAKNFSLFIESEGRYRLTPFYDILSMYPAMGGRGIDRREAKLAMGLTGSRGKKYAIEQIFPRHFFQTAKAVGFARESMENILAEFAQTVDTVITAVRSQLPVDFPTHISEAILAGLQARSRRLMSGWE